MRTAKCIIIFFGSPKYGSDWYSNRASQCLGIYRSAEHDPESWEARSFVPVRL